MNGARFCCVMETHVVEKATALPFRVELMTTPDTAYFFQQYR
jgi:hypothetical protein